MFISGHPEYWGPILKIENDSQGADSRWGGSFSHPHPHPHQKQVEADWKGTLYCLPPLWTYNVKYLYLIDLRRPCFGDLTLKLHLWQLPVCRATLTPWTSITPGLHIYLSKIFLYHNFIFVYFFVLFWQTFQQVQFKQRENMKRTTLFVVLLGGKERKKVSEFFPMLMVNLSNKH